MNLGYICVVHYLHGRWHCTKGICWSGNQCACNESNIKICTVLLQSYILHWKTEQYSVLPMRSLNGPKKQCCHWILQNSLLPSWSPFGDFGPHGDQNFGPHFFFKVPIFFILGLRMRQKSVQPLSNVNHLITCDNKNWFQKLSTGPNGD